MRKAVLSNRIYMEVSPGMETELREKLNYTIPSFNEYDPPTVINNLTKIREGLVSLPIGRTDLIPEGYSIVDKRVLAPTKFPEFKFKLRESQQGVYDEFDSNAIINASVSWGKTFMGLAIAGKLSQKTLVVVHTVPLRNQWAKEVEKVYGFKPSIIGSGSFDTSMPITIGNTQTLYKNIAKVSRLFGTVILDEMHHVSSPTFSKIVDSSFAKYKIGLSGTLERKDGKHVIFRDYFSNKVYKPPKENYIVPEVHIYKLGVKFMDGSGTPWAIRVNNLVENMEYQHSVAAIASKYAAKKHNVLVVSDRVAFLENVSELIGDNAISITGKVDHTDRDKLMLSVGAGDINVLCGTQAMFSEGISHSPLSCLVLGTPVNNDPLLEQLIGRVVREYPGKQTPIIVDINLLGNTASRQASMRLGHYIKQGYKIRMIDVRS
jgi:superfamily II DNA or RNA helicase